MELHETTYLLCNKVPVKKKAPKDPESGAEEFRYYAVYPSSLKARLCLFWTLWAILVILLLVSILTYCCVTPYTCSVNKGRLETQATLPVTNETTKRITLCSTYLHNRSSTISVNASKPQGKHPLRSVSTGSLSELFP